MTKSKRTLPAVALAVGILVATAIAAFTQASFGSAIAASLVLACAIVLASRLAQTTGAPATSESRVAAYAAGAVVLAAGIVALVDPASVAMMLPILGGGAVVVLGERPRCRGQAARQS